VIAASSGVAGAALLAGIAGTASAGTSSAATNPSTTPSTSTAPVTTTTVPPPPTTTSATTTATTTTVPSVSTTTTAPQSTSSTTAPSATTTTAPASTSTPSTSTTIVAPAPPATTSTVPPDTTSTTTSSTGAGQRAQAQFGNNKLMITETLAPTTIVANGTSTSVATATVTCNFLICTGPFPAAIVTFTSSDPAEKVSSTANHGDGTYTATITSSTTAETATITASTPDLVLVLGAGAVSPEDATTTSTTIPTGPPIDTATAVLTQEAGPAAKISESVSPSSIPADGKSKSVATAKVTDSFGNPVIGDQVSFASSDPGEKVGATTPNGDGTYSATVTASESAGTDVITATDTSVDPAIHGSARLTQTPLPATAIHLVISPTSISADGTSTATLTATVTNALGAAVTGQHVVFSSTDSGQQIGPVSDSSGTYTALVTASTTAGTSTITATDTSVTPHLETSGVLTETAVPVTTTTVAPAATTAGATPSSSVLPFTGSNATRMSELAAALLATGGGLTVLVRRRRRRGDHFKE
jgi:adhesin/invasin